ncbi:MAG: 4Fe-4S dicluster domain-containing protein [Verrucomicrobiales bacterium]|nr:4Fe-4S dicluster domain-containing protein [Verrucomicrobiales bacterium]
MAKSDIPWENVGPEFKVNHGKVGMLLDLNRCVGCHSCSVSCKTEHEVPLGVFRMRVRYLERPEAKTLAFAPMLCMHCEDAPCLKACPSKAITRLEDGRVIVEESKCDLEEECISACPYGAIFINEDKAVAEKCDFCHHRTEVGLEPACVATCPSGALEFGDLDNPDGPLVKSIERTSAKPWKEDAGTKPTVFYAGHEKWMEAMANTGVQLDPEDADITYEQNNLKK